MRTKQSRIILNSAKWITKTTLLEGRVYGKLTTMQKGPTGVGATTAFLKIPPKEGKTNILLMPNKAGVISKERAYKRGKIPTENKIAFIYKKEENDFLIKDNIDFEKFDLIVLVADSFYLAQKQFRANSNKIDWVVIDEAHTVWKDSLFRKRLINFEALAKTLLPEAAITSITATPLKYQKVDVVVKFENVENRIINISENEKNCFERSKGLIEKGEKVLVATNNVRLIAKYAVNGVLKCNLKAGKNLLSNLVELVKIEIDYTSNLTIISSAAFESFDLHNGKNHVFIFENRSHDFTTFYAANIIQIIGRSRKGTKEIWWSRTQRKTQKKETTLKWLWQKFRSKQITPMAKLTDENYLDLLPFIFEAKADKLKPYEFALEFNLIAYKLYKERFEVDKFGVMQNMDLFALHGFALNDISEGVEKINFAPTTEKKKIESLKLNIDFLSKTKLFADLFCLVKEFDKRDATLKHFKQYLRRKYYDKEQPIHTYRESLTLHVLSNKNIYESFVTDVYDYAPKMKRELKERYVNTLLLMFSNKRITVGKHKKVFRDYSILGKVGMEVIKKMAVEFAVPINEFDVRTEIPRILFALSGKEIPPTFYGKDKEEKKEKQKAINGARYYGKLEEMERLSNGIAKDKRSRTRTKALQQYENRKQKLIKSGYPVEVAKYVLNRFFLKPKGSLFHELSWYEMDIIEKVIDVLKDESINENTTFLRRHDSVIVFGEFPYIPGVIENFEYLGQKGWLAASENDVKTLIKAA